MPEAIRKARSPAYRDLQLGDPWTFIMSTPISNPETGEQAKVGETIIWRFEPNEPARAFEIRAIHRETVY
jgi:hypothetical protein